VALYWGHWLVLEELAGAGLVVAAVLEELAGAGLV